MALGSLVADDKGLKGARYLKMFFFFSSKLGQGVGLHGMSCECPVIKGIWRCLWAMPLLESWLARVVWHWRTPFSALPCFCSKLTSTIDLPHPPSMHQPGKWAPGWSIEVRWFVGTSLVTKFSKVLSLKTMPPFVQSLPGKMQELEGATGCQVKLSPAHHFYPGSSFEAWGWIVE